MIFNSNDMKKHKKKSIIIFITLIVILIGSFGVYKYKQAYDSQHMYDGKIVVYMRLGSSEQETISMFNELFETDTLDEITYSSADALFEKYYKTTPEPGTNSFYSIFICLPKSSLNYDKVYAKLKKLEISTNFCDRVSKGGKSR
ncbi:hypothetical protein [Enterococcus wangshanyuanii]|uniref:FtsX extracellular domain-containing protein n=1 Tax=Enterococcus wangshanyuanii TaxID=2005703 RepID=A0ABQ1PIQ1_9ENTE|nr:hypothetical protein [Enterococcus wangshanyuanii]GGC97776.1 hypothetical protein GCM10011573_29120 [Enterococcus wangshanyuanii]